MTEQDLAALRQVHDELLALINELEDLLRASAPDRERLAETRWRLTRASRRRRSLIARIVPELLAGASPADAERLKSLSEAHLAAAAASTDHIGRWTPEAILVDWNGYRQASAAMREAMRSHILSERFVLYPLLDVARTRP